MALQIATFAINYRVICSIILLSKLCNYGLIGVPFYGKFEPKSGFTL